jgi:hypothetical protein
VFWRTGFAGISLAGAGQFTFSGNVLRNNILAASVFAANDTRWPWYTRELAGKPVQVMVGRLGGFVFERNALFGATPGEPHLITSGRRDEKTHGPPRDLAWWQANHPGLFRANIEAEPRFVDERRHDFRLKPASPMIDAGAFLTAAVGNGRGAAMPVQDAAHFCDGFGIPGQQGDLIQLEGQTQAVRIVGIDRDRNVLSLAESLEWREGQGVATRFAGSRPDLGAFEFTAEEQRHCAAAAESAMVGP